MGDDMDQTRVNMSYGMREPDIYSTIQGDTWDIIALKVYGNERYMSNLLKANPKHIDILFFSAGVEIVCPDIEQDAVESLPPWKK